MYRKPKDLVSAQVFSDPPINTAKISKRGKAITIFGNVKWPAGKAATGLPDGDYTIGIRPHNIAPVGHGKAMGAVEGRVLVTELSGSESVIHFDVGGQTWISQAHGIHPFTVGATTKLHVDIDQSLFFGANNEFIA